MKTETRQSSANSKDESQLVTFLLKDEEFGFDIMSVQEIIRVPKMAKVPRTPEYVEGIANLRGVVLPIIDMRARFQMERAEETDRTRILVIDINGDKTGLRVDRVRQVTRVMRSEIEPPPNAIRGSSADYLQGVVKLDQGKRIVMALNASHVCQIENLAQATSAKTDHQVEAASEKVSADAHDDLSREVQQMVTFRIGKEEFAFPMEHVREILRVQTPNQVPDVPDFVLGVLTVRGQILTIIDLRRLLHQRSLADEVAFSCSVVREEYERWIDGVGQALASRAHMAATAVVTETLRTWLSTANTSSQVLMEALAKARVLNERVTKLLQNRAKCEERGDLDGVQSMGQDVALSARDTVAALRQFEQQTKGNIQDDQRIIVVDAEGFLLGLVVDHVHEVLNVPKKFMDPPPRITSNGGLELSGIAKLNDGARLIMLLDVANLMKDENLRQIKESDAGAAEARHASVAGQSGLFEEHSEVQLVTFLLADEEYGIPISQIQEIDRLSKITKVPKAARFIDGITNLRGEVIPVLDTRKRFDIEVKPADDRTRIIIVDVGGTKTGLVVDSVREVLSLARKDIAPPPEAIGSGIDQQFISGIGKVNNGKRMIVLLDVEKILSRTERKQLSEITAD